MIKKQKEDFNNNLLKVSNLLSISGHYNIVGLNHCLYLLLVIYIV